MWSRRADRLASLKKKKNARRKGWIWQKKRNGETASALSNSSHTAPKRRGIFFFCSASSFFVCIFDTCQRNIWTSAIAVAQNALGLYRSHSTSPRSRHFFFPYSFNTHTNTSDSLAVADVPATMASSSNGLQSSYLKLDNLEGIYNSPIGDHIPHELRGKNEQDENQSLCPSFSFRERLIGFCACVAGSLMCSIIAWVMVFKGDLNTFAVVNTVANLFSVGSTLFLVGPMRQVKNMLKSYRWAATLIFVACMVLTFVFALAVKVPFLTIITVLLQYLAMTWYTLSYIPFARDAILACFGCRWCRHFFFVVVVVAVFLNGSVKLFFTCFWCCYSWPTLVRRDMDIWLLLHYDSVLSKVYLEKKK